MTDKITYTAQEMREEADKLDEFCRVFKKKSRVPAMLRQAANDAKESDFIYFIAKLKAFEYLRRRSQGQSFCYEDFVNAEMKFYKEELEFHSRKGAKNGK